MRNKVKSLLRNWTPPVVIRTLNRLHARSTPMNYGLSGDYRTWEEASRASTGYDSEIILEKTTAALLKVQKSKVACEQDSVVFDEITYSWPLLAGLMWVAAQSGGKLNVLDFGGSLGSNYFRNRGFLTSLTQVRWNIIEQIRHVDVGKKLFEDDQLKFYRSVEDCLAETEPNIVILCSVLQYVECPYDILSGLLRLPCKCIFIDRTPFWDGPKDRLCVQSVPPSIYAASYPSWIFSMQRFKAHLNKDWDVVAEFNNADKIEGPIILSYKGMILSRGYSQSSTYG